MILIWIFFSIINCETKYLCFTTGPVSNYKCTNENTVTEVNNETEFTPLITSRVKDTDKDIYIFLSGSIEFEFPLNIFNGKNLTVRFTDSTSSGLFDISETSNIGINLLYLDYAVINPNVTLEGDNFNDLQSTITLQNIDLETSFTDIRVKSFKSIHSTYSFTNIQTNSFVYQINNDLNVTFNNNIAVFDDTTVEFRETNPIFNIIFSGHNNLIIMNEANTASSLPSLSIENAKSITFNGNGFTKSNSFSLTNCPLIIANSNYIPLDSLVFTNFAPTFQVIAVNSFTVKKISLEKKQNLTIDVSDKHISSRISVNIESLSLKSGSIILLNSWIDLATDDFKFETSDLPISPCLGSGGSSTFIAKQATFTDDTKDFQIKSLSIRLDITGTQTDQTLSKLISQPWESIKFVAFSSSSQDNQINTISFTPNNIYGFGSTEADRIVKAAVTSTNNLIITITASSLNTIPLLICYTDDGSCPGGVAINDTNKLSEIIPSEQKSINLSISKEGNIDLTTLKTIGATFSIVQGKKSSSTVNSILMDKEYPNNKIKNLILESIHFGSGYFEFNANEITFKLCRTTVAPNISFNEKDILYIDDYSYDKLRSHIDGIYPITHFVTQIDQQYSSFEITDSKYVFKNSYSEIDFPFPQIPKVFFNIGLSSNEDYIFNYKVSTKTIDSVTLNFATHKLYSAVYNPKVTVNLDNFRVIEKATKIELDFGGLDAGNTVDLNYVPRHNYFTFKGENIIVKNAEASPENNFCVCKEKPCLSGLCDSDMTQITFSELNQKVHDSNDDIVKITIVGEQDGSCPTLSLGSIDNKNAKINGVGTNPTIKIDGLTEFSSLSHKLEFSKIKIVHSSGEALRISNLILNEDCTIDSSFKSVPFKISSLHCYVNHLISDTIQIGKLLELKGDATNTESSSKVKFSPSSNFSYELPSSITIQEAKLVFKNLEFDLTNVLPSFSFSEELNEFTITGNNGYFSSLSSDLILRQTGNLKTVYIKGTWNNDNPTKFLVLDKFSSDLYLDSEAIPMKISYLTNKKIILERKVVTINGQVSFKGSYSGNYEISTSVAGGSSLTINHAHITSGIVNVQFASTNIDLNIDTYTSESQSPKFKFFLLIDLDGENHLAIHNAYKSDVEFTYDVHCTINERLNNEKMINFINNNHTLIVVNSANAIKIVDSITFDDDATIGFDNNHFKLEIVNKNKLVFYTHKSPLKSDVTFYYGECTSSCVGTKLTNDDLTVIDQLIPMKDAEITITFYDSIEGSKNFIDLNKPNLDIQFLTLKSSFSAVNKNVNIIFGSSVSYLNLQCITLNNVANDEIKMKKATLKKGSSFGLNANLAGVDSIVIDQDSLFESKFTEFPNDLSLTIESSTYITLNYTSAGMKIIKSFNSQLTVFNIDVSKMPNVQLSINSKQTPKINLEKGVKQLKQIKNLIFDSSTFVIGSNWDDLNEDSKVEYSFNSPPNSEVVVITDSFPFDAWDLMYEYTIQFSGVLSPFVYKDEFELENKKLKINTYIPTHHKYSDVTFYDLVLSKEASIIHGEETTTKKLIIKKLTVEKDSKSAVIGGYLTDSLTLEEGSQLQSDFTIDPYVMTLNIEWDLDNLPLLNPSQLQSIHPTEINLIYKGHSISGKEKEFDNLLLNGVTFMKNVEITEKTLSHVHFESDDEPQFNDGEKLALKCQINDQKEIQLISTKSFSGQTSPPQSNTVSQTKTVTYTITQPPTLPVVPPIVDELSVDDSHHLMSNKITFMKNGFIDDDMAVETTSDTKDVLLIRARERQVTVTTETENKPRQRLFLYPSHADSEFVIEKLNDYGLGEFGIRPSSLNPKILISATELPLNLYSDEEQSRATFELGKDSLSVKLSLKKLTINSGKMTLNLPQKVQSIEFDEVETYSNSWLETLVEGQKLRPIIDKMSVKNGSTVTTSKVKFNKELKLGLYSKVAIDEDVTFTDDLSIKMTSSSFIELGESSIHGVCREVRMVGDALKKLNKEEVNIELICGKNFICSDWKDKFVGDETFKQPKCILNKNKEMCLVASDLTEKEKEVEKKKVSLALIFGILVGAVGVISIAATLIYRYLKVKRTSTKGYVSQDKQAAPELEEVLTNDAHIDI
ncbi:hypothetical protein M9Y10_038873 [Tritrichomonas musculus]|uniref:Uncharacterized protein n=1 Tax=Tritrichomonas musculus TaxID=1915356 RepID=A0ABR2K9N2_9EUKA